jgi:hypothetical protein
VDRTTQALGRLRRFAQAMDPTTAPIEAALPAVRALLDAAAVPYRFVGGVAVVHHGYARTTDDIGVLVDGADLAALDGKLAAFDFVRESRSRLRHAPTGVRVDLLVGGDPSPRAGEPPYPSPASVATSEEDAAFAALAPLLELKLRARRHQDLADVVELLKKLDDARYVAVEASVDARLRTRLAELRRDALEELTWKR